MKTPIQEVFSDLEANHSEFFDIYTEKGRTFINNYSKYLKKEKELVVNFHLFLRDNGDKHIGLTIEEFVELYFKQL